jgi:hypothetical protein
VSCVDRALRVGYLALTLACLAAEVAAAEAREFTLDNALKLIVQEDHRALVVVPRLAGSRPRRVACV